MNSADQIPDCLGLEENGYPIEYMHQFIAQFPAGSALDPETKAVWLEDLLSGDFKQGTGMLRAVIHGETRYCCLGILGEIEHPDWAGLVDNVNDAGGGTLSMLPLASVGTLPSHLACGLTRPAQMRLAEMNDAGYTFEQIAHLIEVAL